MCGRQSVDLGLLGQIAGERGHVSPLGPHSGRGVLCFIAINICDGDLRAAIRQVRRDRGTDTPRPARYQGIPVLQNRIG